MLKVIPFAHQLMKDIVEPGDTVIDATCGNGNDALFLSTLVGASGHVYACDIQEQAIIATKELLASNERINLTYIQDSHANIDQYLPTSVVGHITAAVFNLGYLPKSDKSIITKPHSTIKAMEHILSFLKKRGRLIAVIYHGHDGGDLEKDAVIDFAQHLDQSAFEVLQYQFINQQNTPPFVIAIEKK